MIKSIYIDNFKSLVDFNMELAKFSCLVGLNGVGKTTILQALDFLAQLPRGDLDDWLAHHKWNTLQLKSKLTTKKNIRFRVTLCLSDTPEKQLLVWEGEFNRTGLYCSKERITLGPQLLLNVENGQYRINGNGDTEIDFEYQGSILSQLRIRQLPQSLRNLKDTLLNLKSLELLTPYLLKQRSSSASFAIGGGGKHLAAFIDDLSISNKARLLKKLKVFYPHLTDIRVRVLRSGLKEVVIQENYLKPNRKNLETHSYHISDGMLRIIAILAQSLDPQNFLLFDEIENGINPEIIEKLVRFLVDMPQQVMVTTHSPMIINYLSDEQAKEAMLFVYKTPQGATRVRRFFDSPRMQEKLLEMGPGEAYVDTYLDDLVAEFQEMDEV